MDDTASDRLDKSVQGLRDDLQAGKTIYGKPEKKRQYSAPERAEKGPGVNTGFGGSADTRTDRVNDLQASLISLLQCGIIYPASITGGPTEHTSDQPTTLDLMRRGLALDDPASTNSMPESWVRSAILVRINSLLHGVSSVRPEVVNRMVDLLKLNIIPRVPMHESISASGDLSPLAYIAGCVQGKPSVSVHVGRCHRFMTAEQAITDANLRATPLEAKEGLAIVNGTAFSSGVSALVMWGRPRSQRPCSSIDRYEC